MSKLNVDRILDALDSVVWYQGLSETVMGWKDIPRSRYGFIGRPDGLNAQGEVLWIIAVELFGDCGTSPRYGWIDDIDGFKDFVDKITASFRSQFLIEVAEDE